MPDRARVTRGVIVHIAYTYGGSIFSLCGKPYAWADVLRGPPREGQRLCLMCARVDRKPPPE